MDNWMRILLALGLSCAASAQYDQGNRGLQFNQPTPASILHHKQALGQDGSFNYAFAADNGLQQGEVINPDGSRRGSYSYVDPNGKTVSLSYTAGKDGFRVLDGDHVPKAPEQGQRPGSQHYPRQQLQSPQYFAHQPQHHLQEPRYKGNGVPYESYKNAPNAPVYRGPPNSIPYQEPYRNAHPAPVSQYNVNPVRYEPQYGAPPQSVPFRPAPHYQPRQYSVQEGYPEGGHGEPAQYQGHRRQEKPQKPHSFGNGFAFEFAGK